MQKTQNYNHTACLKIVLRHDYEKNRNTRFVDNCCSRNIILKILFLFFINKTNSVQNH